MKEKYTKAYYLKKDEEGKDTIYGVEGLPEFQKGDIRLHDKDILRRLEFEGKNVLDIGFGRGEALKFAATQGASNLTGVDFSEDAYKIATEFLNNYGIKAELYCKEAIEFLTFYASNLDKKNFDIVMMLDCVEHIPRSELSQILNLISQCLSSRGIVVINTPVFKIDNDVITDGLDLRAKDTSDDFEETAGMHCNRYTKKSLKSYMKDLGFKAISGHFFVPFLPILGVLEGTKQSWKEAYTLGYPISLSAINYPEQFEYAMSWEDIRKSEATGIKTKAINLTKKGWKLSKTIVKKILDKLRFQEFRCFGIGSYGKINQSSWVSILNGPIKNYQMFLNINAPAYWHRAMMEGHYDSFIYDILSQYKNTGAIIWDVGAHIGYHSLSFAVLVGSRGKVVAFEPNLHNAERLRKNFEKNPELSQRIVLMTCALSDCDGQSNFIFSSEIDNGRSSGSHLLQAIVPEEQLAYSTFKKELVTTFKADTLISQNPNLIPSIIKLDVEGAEKFVLEGAVELLSKYQPLLFVEVHNITMMFYVQKLLGEIGYKLEIIDTEHTSLSRCFILAKYRGKH